jgi:hypothetical protein
VAALATHGAVLAAMGTAESQQRAEQVFAALEEVQATASTRVAEHERCRTIVAMLAQCERIRHRAAASGGLKHGESSFQRHKDMVTRAFTLLSVKDQLQQGPLLAVTMRIMGQMLVGAGCACAL